MYPKVIKSRQKNILPKNDVIFLAKFYFLSRFGCFWNLDRLRQGNKFDLDFYYSNFNRCRVTGKKPKSEGIFKKCNNVENLLKKYNFFKGWRVQFYYAIQAIAMPICTKK